MKKYELVKCSNMIFVVNTGADMVVKAWEDEEFTERKLNNYVKKMSKLLGCEIELVKKL